MLQNGTVVLMQVFGGEALKKAQEHANFILHFILTKASNHVKYCETYMIRCFLC